MADPAKLDTLQSVELADGVEIRLRMAGPLPRAGAYVIDLMIRGLVMTVISIVMAFSNVAIGENVVAGLLMLAWFLMDWLYPVVFESGKRGATPGKRLAGAKNAQANAG